MTPRTYSEQHSQGLTLGELAVRFGCELRGDPDIRVYKVASIETAAEGEIAFLASRKFESHLKTTQASAVIVDPAFADQSPVAVLLAKNPHAMFARIASLLHAAPVLQPQIHPSAVVDSTAQIDATAFIGPNCVIGANVSISARVIVGPNCTVLDAATIAEDTRLVANVTVCERVRIGRRCILHPSAVIGSDGFGFANEAGKWEKVPQIGSVLIGDDVEIGASTTIDRGAIGDTIIEDGVKLDNQIQIAHNVRVGAHTAMAAGVGVSGSTTIGKHCMIAGMAGIAGWLTICDRVIITGKTMVSHSIKEPGTYSGMLPMDDARKFRRNVARFKKLDDLAKQVRAMRGEHDANDELNTDDTE
jgi:UDP-3-O-[3-hydroxymyristoyl] glucosamine N-acyltransferase